MYSTNSAIYITNKLLNPTQTNYKIDILKLYITILLNIVIHC